jgi:hypothetical protein
MRSETGTPRHSATDDQRPTSYHLIALGELILNAETEIGKGGLVHPDELFERLATPNVIPIRLVSQGVGVGKLVTDWQILKSATA